MTLPDADAASSAGAWGRSVASSYGYTVPRRFLWLADLLVLAAATLVAQALAPLVQRLVGPGGPLRVAWLSWLSLPSAEAIGDFRPLGDILWIPLVMVPVTLLFLQLLGGHHPLLEQSRTRLVATTVFAPLIGLSFITLVLVALRHQRTSRALIFSLAILSALGLLGYRAALRAYKRRRLRAGHYVRNVVVIGSADAARWMAAHFARAVAPTLYRLRARLGEPAAPDDSAEPQPGGAPDLPHLGPPDALAGLLVNRPIHEVIAIGSVACEGWLASVIEQCDYFRVTLRIVPEQLLSWTPRDLHSTFRAGALQLPEIVLTPRNLDSDALFVKRVFDILVSGVMLMLLSPLLALIAVAIKLTTPGLPVFYAWRVVGYKGRPFVGYKFSTMVADADKRKAELTGRNEMSGPVFKIKDDPRVTPLGRWLRRFSLDELPQLWSVFKGDMSLVGPRPALPNELDRYELWQKRKLCVQPGVTCLWQVSGRNEISSFDDWVRLDFEYIDNWSLWLDCRILLRTVWTVFGGSGR